VTGASSGSGSASIVETADDLAAAVAEALAHGPGVAEPFRGADQGRVPRPQHAGLGAGGRGEPGAQPAIGRLVGLTARQLLRQASAPVVGYRPS
jgi:hypothetical protein